MLAAREAIVRWQENITVDPGVLAGKPIIKGTRMAVEFVVGLLADGWTVEQVLAEYDHLSAADIRAVWLTPVKSSRTSGSTRFRRSRKGEPDVRCSPTKTYPGR